MVQVGKNLALSELTPLQLATKFGDHAMFRWLLRKHTKVRWVWGLVQSKSFDLSEIDSINKVHADPSHLCPVPVCCCLSVTRVAYRVPRSTRAATT